MSNPETPACRRALDLPDWLRGFGDERQNLALSRHLRRCPACRDDAVRLREAMRLVEADPGLPPHPDLAPSILAALPDDAFRRAQSIPRLLAPAAGTVAAAGLLLILSLVVPQATNLASASPEPHELTHALSSGGRWLIDQQLDDGTFCDAPLPGQDGDPVAVTALALGAMTGLERTDVRTRAAMDSAWRALVREQQDSGRIGVAGAPGDLQHALATWALARLQAKRPWPELRSHLEHAVSHLLAAQDEGGGFGSVAHTDAGPPLRITAWALEALEEARLAGLAGLEGSIAGARERLAVADACGTRLPVLASGDLLRRQVRQGPLAGSWRTMARKRGMRRVQATCVSLIALQEVALHD